MGEKLDSPYGANDRSAWLNLKRKGARRPGGSRVARRGADEGSWAQPSCFPTAWESEWKADLYERTCANAPESRTSRIEICQMPLLVFGRQNTEIPGLDCLMGVSQSKLGKSSSRGLF